MFRPSVIYVKVWLIAYALEDWSKNAHVTSLLGSFNNCSKFPRINFKVVITAKEWFAIKPHQRRFQDKKLYTIFKPGWTHLISRKICMSDVKLPCAFSFKKYQIKKGLEFYFFGRCKEKRKDFTCGNSIYGQFSHYSKGQVIVDITSRDTRGIKHLQKRNLSGKRRSKAQKYLQYITASKFRKKQSRELMQYGDAEPPDINKSITYRKPKQEVNIEKYGFQKGDSALTTFWKIFKREKKKFHHTSLRPFSTFYQTSEQIALVREISSKMRLIFNIDATRNCPYALNVNNNITDPIFFMSFVHIFRTMQKIIPVFQWLSERQTTVKIKDGLEHLISVTGVYPDECTFDGSAALWNAGALAFNNCSWKENLQANHDFLEGKTSELKRCYLRDDKNHFIKAFIDMKCWQIGDNIEKKAFYTHCLSYCIETSNKKNYSRIFQTHLRCRKYRILRSKFSMRRK